MLPSSPWTVKPPVGVQPCWGHPLHPRHAWLMNEGVPGSIAGAATPFLHNLGSHGATVAPPAGVVSSIIQWSVAQRGMVIRQVIDGSGAGLYWNDASRFLNTGGGFSIVMAYRKTDATNRASVAIGVGISVADGERLNVHLPWSDGTVYWDYGGTTDAATRVSASGLTFGDDVWVFSTGPMGMQIWQNGILRASNSANPTRTQTTVPLILTEDLADIGFAYLYHRQLTPTEARRISFDPYCWMQPPTSLFAASSRAAVLSGTVTAAITEADIVAGGKTIILTLSGDTFITN